MGIHAACDMCGEWIVGSYARFETGGRHDDDDYVDRRLFTYHAGDRDDEDSCFRHALRMLDDVRAVGVSREEAPEEFGLEWRLVREDEPRDDEVDDDMPWGERLMPDPAWREKLLATPIDAFPALTHQHIRNLKRAGMHSLGDIAARSREELLALPGVGGATMVTASVFVDALCLRAGEAVREAPQNRAGMSEEAE